MPHVTMIHGIANKPAADTLLARWRFAMRDAGLDLGAEGVGSSMVYWADLFYEHPRDVGSYESLETGSWTSDAEDDLTWIEALQPTEREFVEALRVAYHLDTPPPTAEWASAPPPGGADGTFERIPLPWAVKRPLMEALLRGVHHYLFNAESEPRPGERYRVRDEIRRRFVAALELVGADGPHVVLSHSMGTVIAYDCLKRVPECPSVDGLVTLGSPLGMAEIQDRLKPGHSRRDGFPSTNVEGPWVNHYDSLDVVPRLDPAIANDFRKSGAKVVHDVSVRNTGLWRHTAEKYLRQQMLVAALSDMLGLET